MQICPSIYVLAIQIISLDQLSHKLQFSFNHLFLNPGTSQSPTGPRLNIKTVLSTYGDFHVKDKTAVRTSYL